jgi:hypothetical protein
MKLHEQFIKVLEVNMNSTSQGKALEIEVEILFLGSRTLVHYNNVQAFHLKSPYHTYGHYGRKMFLIALRVQRSKALVIKVEICIPGSSVILST